MEMPFRFGYLEKEEKAIIWSELYLYTIVIDISKRKSKKYYNISASRSTANTHFTTFYAFNGKKYVENGKKETPVY